ncbi:MAG: hypothetical protein E7609_06000 [Ruminococcaceae bacterium]|nr:hypothetical protein [Oscillospiraceae bacterium]
MRQYLDAIFGNRESCRSLGESIEKNALSHALLIEGDAGSGKRTFAKEVAKAMLCENRENKSMPLPCSECRACYLVDHELALDLHFITKGERATIGVDTVREVIEDTNMSSTEFSHKIYVFEDAHTMTAGAQNALLKTMEEPPEGVKLILLTESADSMLTTVRSRARLLRMQRFTKDEIKAYLQENEPELIRPYSSRPEELEAILLLAGGSIGEAIRLLSPESAATVKKERDKTLAVLNALSGKSYAPLSLALAALPAKREELKQSLLLLHTALCDLILLKRAERPPLSFFPSAEELPESIAALRIHMLFAFTDAIEEAVEQLDRNAGLQSTVTMLAAKLRNAQKER